MERSRMYKNQDKDSAEMRRRRQDESVELRKAKKDDTLQKRRNITAADLDDDVLGTENRTTSEAQANQPFAVKDSTTADNEAKACINRLIQLANSGGNCDLEDVRDCVQKCRALLSKAHNPPIDLFVEGKAVPILLELLHDNVPMELQFEATWALTNIASGTSEQTKAVVDANAVEAFIRLLDSPSANVAEQAAWALGNIAGDCCEYRDLVVNKGIVDPLIKLLNRSKDNATMIGHIAWVMSNLCRTKHHKPPPPSWVLERLVPHLADIAMKRKGLNSSLDATVDAFWALTYASECTHQEILEAIIRTGVVKTLVDHMSLKTAENILTPSLRCVGNMLTGSDEMTEEVLTYGLLKRLNQLIKHPKSAIVKETCWLLSNITAGTPGQIEQVVHSGVLPRVIQAMVNGDSKTQREALWTVSNLVNSGKPSHLQHALDLKVLSNCVHLLRDSQPKVITLCMELIHGLLTFANGNGHLEEYAVEFESVGGLDLLESLQEHENEEVYNHALNLVERFFNSEELSVMASDGQAEIAFESTSTGANNGPAFTF